jgi:Protein of unknown function (DUF2723)
MALISTTTRDPRLALLADALAAAVPFIAYLATASPAAYWLDSGEFVEAAVMLDIAHPPGHPLAALLGYLMSLVPLGPLPLRIALGQAACAALAGLFAFRAYDLTIRAMGVRHDRIAIPAALASTWVVTGATGWWFQAVRPEVYALQALLLAVVVHGVIRVESAWPTSDVRPLWPSALALGLALANHHFMAVLVLPALMPTLARVYRARGPRVLSLAGAATAIGLGAYAYLPVRASTHPPVDLGHPTDLGSLLWVVSAKAYQHSHGISQDGPLVRAADVLLAILESVPGPAIVLSFCGVWAVLRVPGAKRLGWIWGALAFFACVGRTWLGQTSGNPDALGYLMPAFLGLGGLGAAFLGALAGQLLGSATMAPRKLMVALAFGAAALSLSTFWQHRTSASLAQFHATDELDELRVRAVPARAVVIVHLPQTAFRHWELLATEAARPDVTLVPLPFLGYPGVARALLARDPMLTELVREYASSGQLSVRALQSLAERRPVLVELDVRVPVELYETLAPSAIYHQVLDSEVTAFELEDAAARRATVLRDVQVRIGADLADPETRNQLLWIHYMDALYYAQLGNRTRARESIGRALEFAPNETRLAALAATLEGEGGAVDVRPFVVGLSP